MFPIDKTDEWEARQDAKRQPSQPASEPERVSDERLEEIPFESSHSAEFYAMARELRTLRKQRKPIYVCAVDAIPDLTLQAHETCDGEVSSEEIVKMWEIAKKHITQLEAQLAEKDAAIEKARQDALAEAAKIADKMTNAAASVLMKKHNDVAAVQIDTAHEIAIEIRALAAQKKEG